MLPKENLLNSSVLFAGCYGGIQRRHIFLRCPQFSGKDRNGQIIIVSWEALNAMLRLLNLVLWAIEYCRRYLQSEMSVRPEEKTRCYGSTEAGVVNSGCW